MDGDRTLRALARIDAALVRLEGAARQSAAQRQAAQDLAGLKERHDRLRAAVTDGLQQLDQLIEGTGA